jgi:predicted alpha/beta superfamily hydrolase
MALDPHVMLRRDKRSEAFVGKMLSSESLWLRTETGSRSQMTEQLPRICLYINNSGKEQRREKKLQQFGKDGK